MAEEISLNMIRGDLNLNLKIQIQNGHEGFIPDLVDSVTLTTERKNSPGKLEFSVVWDEKLNIEEGNPVSLTVKDKVLFYGFIFTFKHTKSAIVKITAYDQIRYLLNKDTYYFKNITASAMINMIAKDCGITTGTIEETGYTIPARLMDNKTLLDMIQDGLEITLTNNRTLFCLYDDSGKLTLKQSVNMKVGILIDADAAEDFDYSSTIDSGVYNVIKLIRDDDGTRTAYVAKDDTTNKKWGSLQYFEKIDDTANATNKANTLLRLYNTKNKSLTLRNVVGDIRVRAGCMVLVRLTLHDMNISNWMLVESCTHKFSNNRHTMNLKLRGGEFAG